MISKPLTTLLCGFSLYCLALHPLYAISLQGHATQGGLMLGQVPVNTKVFIDDQAVMVTDSGKFAFGFGRDAAASAQLKIIDTTGKVDLQKIKVKPRKFNIQRIDGLPASQVNPKKPETLARIKQDTQQVKLARSQKSQQQFFAKPFIWPAAGKITGVYGSQRILNGEPKWPHYGLDIAGPIGSTVIAPASGVVTLAVPDMYYSGGTVIIDHGDGINSTFLHLSKILIQVGQSVKQGDIIAKMGASGRATGPHLDWRLNWFNVRLDPRLLMHGKPPKKLKFVDKVTGK